MATTEQSVTGQSTATVLTAMSAENAELEAAAGGPITDTLAAWLAARYAPVLERVFRDVGDDHVPPELLHQLCNDLVALRKGDHSAARLKLERERLDLERENSEARQLDRFEQWLKEPETMRRFARDNLSDEERERRLRRIFNLAPVKRGGLSDEALTEIESALHML